MEKEQKTRILVIEDDPDVLAMLIKHLEYLDYAVITATDGMEGLKQLQSAEYDLVINIPPGMTKSTLTSILLPTWCWTRCLLLAGESIGVTG